MRQILRLFLFVAFVLPWNFSFGQTVTTTTVGCPGVPGACGYHPSTTNSSTARQSPPMSPQNGNGTLGVIYDQAKCGLDYTSASQRLGKRFSPAGVNQPAPFVISGIPACATIEKAYLWAEGSGNGAAQTATVNGPLGAANYPMTIVGQGPDKCWGYSGTYTYRADVTASVNGNGTYNISGILTNPPTSGNDMDGATLVVIWSQPSAAWQGRIVIADGAFVVNGGTATYNMPISPAVCGATTNARAFCGLGDIQMAVSSLTLNGTNDPITWNWWNFEQVNTTVAAGQGTSAFVCNTGGDCFNMCIAGLYFRTTTCAVCPTTTAFTVTPTSTPASCSACNGTASVTVSPAGAYSYNWSPAPGAGQGTSSVSGLCAGVYTVTVTTSCSTVTATVNVVTSGGSITVANTAQTNVNCNAACNGSATINASGGTSPYTFTWSPSVTNSTVGSTNTGSNICAGTYTVTGTDATGCSGTLVVTVTQPPAITFTQSQTNASCNGGCNGTASVVASGGSGSFTYNWSPAPGGGQGTANATGLCAGTYTCTIADAAAPTCTTTATFNITQPSPISATSTFTAATCGNSNGSASVTASGGAGGYTYNWSPAPGGGQGTNTATGIPQGTYTCTITDANLCTYTISVVVPSAASPTVTITAHTDVTCFNACDGTATASATGGTAPYSYNWSPAPGAGQGTGNASQMCPGTYTITVTDANNCTSTDTVTITQPAQLLASGAQTDVTCFGACDGTASITASGGSGPYTYNWSPAPGAGQGTGNATQMCAGSYTCTVTDANNCTTTVTFTITEPPQLTIAAAGFNVTCYGACDGQLVVIPNGGTPPYTFNWSTGCTTASCNNICAGSYTITVTDLNGCSATATASVTEPPPITVSTTTVDAHCGQPDGSATATFSGGTGTLTPVWYNPPQPSGATYNNIPAGIYYVVVTDQNGCDDTATVTVNNLPGVIASLGTVTNISCFGANDGSIIVNDNGVNTPYTYSWSCSASTTNTASNLSAGTCTVTLTDAVGCTSSVTATVTQPQALSLAATATPGAVCAGQSVQMSGSCSGGTGAYQYAWAPGPLPGLNQTITPPTSGTYTLYVADANNCVDSATVTVTVDAAPVAALSGDVLAGCSPLCVNFSDLSTITAGTITSWSWDFGDGNTSTQQNASHCYTTPGSYTVILTVSTSNGCTNTITMPNYITVYPNPVADFSANPQPTTELNPTLYFTDGSTNAATWSWSFGDGQGSSTLQNPSYMYSGPGCFDVVLTATSSNGCEDTAVHRVCIDPDVAIFVPNAFTPNGDGINETFFAKGIGIDPEHFQLWIFDRWGNQIYYSEDLNASWDGKVQGHSDLCQEDVYIWKIKAIDMMGKKHNLIGHVSLIR